MPRPTWHRPNTPPGKPADRHASATQTVHSTLHELHKHARLDDGSQLPIEPTALADRDDRVRGFAHQIALWRNAADRARKEIRRATADTAAAASAARGARTADEQATHAEHKAAKETAAVQQIRDLHGAEYEQLTHSRDDIGRELDHARADADRHQQDQQNAKLNAVRAETTLNDITPQRAAAQQHRDLCLERLTLLIDEDLATIADHVPADKDGQPADLAAALLWTRGLLSGHPARPDRLHVLTQSRGRALKALENNVQRTNSELVSFNRQITLPSIGDTDWRRALVADPSVIRGEDLPHAMQTLASAAAQLENDLRGDFKEAMRTGLFAELRRDIQLRRETAQELVKRITDTLAHVRTGVARVGIKVAWAVRKEPDAQRMIELLELPPSDEVFAEMYTVLRERMDHSEGETWAERVANTFDYRNWHEWEISVTHSTFSTDSGAETFRKIEGRANPSIPCPPENDGWPPCCRSWLPPGRCTPATTTTGHA